MLENMPKAGEGIALTKEEHDKITELFAKDADILKNDISLAFVAGYTAGIGFPSVPKDAETHGFDALKYGENALLCTLDEVAKIKLKRLAEGILDFMKEDD